MTKQFKHGFVVARLQPLHNGHKSIIDKMLLECEKITIIIGSVQESRTDKNPFNFQERYTMLKNIYGNSEDWKNMEILQLNDTEDDDVWYNSILELLKNGKFGMADVYYCGDSVNGSFLDRGHFKIINVDRTKQVGNCNISATEIRKMIRNGSNNWKNYVSSENLTYLEQLIKILH